ncbi:hypothetical protein [Paenibacillus gansuensis]|uniref:Uncharacterized protein n=1 Tax=Paenibacillus gansuensis TaxID=306542 RepID=A0ABW5PI59_9BACL
MFLSIKNNKEVLQLPVPPNMYSIPGPWKNTQVDGLKQTLNIIGLKGLRSVEISSFFPAAGHNYPFLQNRTMWGMQYVDTIERWRGLRIPIRLVIIDSSGKKTENMAVVIDDFTHGMATDGDIQYTLQMSEFPFVSTGR